MVVVDRKQWVERSGLDKREEVEILHRAVNVFVEVRPAGSTINPSRPQALSCISHVRRKRIPTQRVLSTVSPTTFPLSVLLQPCFFSVQRVKHACHSRHQCRR